MNRVEIRTAAGICPSYVSRPDGAGPWPAVLMYMDGIGIRPAVLQLGAQLAAHGYFVLLPDVYYRSGPYEPMDAKTAFIDPVKRQTLRDKFLALATNAAVMSDTRYFLDFIHAQPEVKPGKIGVVGYCMGGRLSLTAAGTFPDEIAAMASYHGGGMVTDAPDSPHLGVPHIKSKVYIAGATEDASFPDEQKARLEQALTDAHVDHQLETYPAKHGWVFSDTLTHDAAATERHWQTLLALFEDTLKK